VATIILEIHAEFATTRSRFKFAFSCCYFRLVRIIFYLPKNINNINKKNPRNYF